MSESAPVTAHCSQSEAWLFWLVSVHAAISVGSGCSGRTRPARTSPDHALCACRACGVARVTTLTWCDLARSRRGGYSADAPCTAPPPVSEGCRALNVANRDEPARFGHLQSTLCAPSEPVGSPGSLPSTSSAISPWRLQRHCYGCESQKRSNYTHNIPASRLKGSSCSRFHFEVRHA